MQPSSNDTFQAYLMSGFTVFNKQTSGTFSVNDKNLTMIDDNGVSLFNLPKTQIDSLKDALNEIVIVSQDKKYQVFFRDVHKGAVRMGILGPIWGGGGKNGTFAAGPQAVGKDAVNSLIRHGYNVTFNKHRTM